MLRGKQPVVANVSIREIAIEIVGGIADSVRIHSKVSIGVVASA